MIKHLSKLINLFIAVALVALAAGCGGNEAENKETKDSVAVENAAKKEGKNMFYSLPSPIQLGKLLKKAGANYDRVLLNGRDHASQYSTIYQKSVNLGVYGCDLSYAAIYAQTQDVLTYLNCAKQLGDDLGSAAAFTSETIKSIEANVSNNDSLLSKIADVLLSSDVELKENEQVMVATLATTGAFIEGMYIGTQSARTAKDNTGIIKRVAELKGALNNMLSILAQLEGVDSFGTLMPDLKAIKAIYDETPATAGGTVTVKADSTKGVATIGGSSNYNLTSDQFQRISSKVEALRTSIVKP